MNQHPTGHFSQMCSGTTSIAIPEPFSTDNQLKEVIQDIEEQIKSLERKISRIYQRDIDIDKNVQLKENESNSFLKESVDKEVIHLKNKILIQESTKMDKCFTAMFVIINAKARQQWKSSYTKSMRAINSVNFVSEIS